MSGGLDARAVHGKEIAVVQRLQAEVPELEVARRVQRRAEFLQVEIREPLVQELRLDAAFHELRKVLGVVFLHLRLGRFLPQNLAPDGVKK